MNTKKLFLNDNVTINNHTSIKYLVSTFKGLENLEEKQLDINENFTVYNKYVNVGLNMNYINLINPEYKLGFF